MPAVRFFRAGRELREDTRTAISADPSGRVTLLIKKTRIADEAKYSVVLEQDGVSTDTATFSIFIKGLYSCMLHVFCLLFTIRLVE